MSKSAEAKKPRAVAKAATPTPKRTKTTETNRGSEQHEEKKGSEQREVIVVREGDVREGFKRIRANAEAAGVIVRQLDTGAIVHMTEQLAGFKGTLDAIFEAAPSQPSDAFEELGRQFAAALRVLFDGDLPADADIDVQQAARQAVAEHLWQQRVGRLLTSTEYAQQLGVTRQAVQHQIQNHQVVAARDSRGRWRLPLWQLELGSGAQRLAAEIFTVLTVENARTPLMAIAWFSQTRKELGGQRPLDVLGQPNQHESLLQLAREDASAADR